MSELAMVSARNVRLSQRAEAGDRGAQQAIELARQPTRFLSTVQIGITLVAIVSGAFGGARLADHITPVLEDLGLGNDVAETGSVLVAVLGITYLSLVFGEIVPKRIALHSPEAVASLVSRPMHLLSRAGSPFVYILSISTGAVLRVVGLHMEREQTVTEEEIRLMIDMSAESGSVAEAEAALLDRVFHFGDRHVHEVMTPRTEAVGIERHATIADFYELYLTASHSRFPVFDESPDKVVGILGIKDVLASIAAGGMTPDAPVDSLARPAYFVPETKLIGDLFRELQSTGNQMAIAVDEFGGTAGIVTLERLLEEMVGQVGDELARSAVEITTIDENTMEVDGSLSVEEARDELSVNIPEGPYDTIAGFVLSKLGHIPKVGEFVNVDDYRITIAEMRNLKIERLRMTRI